MMDEWTDGCVVDLFKLTSGGELTDGGELAKGGALT